MNNLLSWESFAALVLGSLFGAVFGSIPGLTATLALSLFVPLALFLDPSLVLPAVIGISTAAIFAGDIGSITVKIPGTAASAAYSDEINRMGKGSIAFAMGVATLPSAVGAMVGVLILMAGAGVLAQFAKQFSSFEYFWLAVLGLVAGIFATQGKLIKGALSLGIGVLISTIGLDPTLGFARFSFGNPNLLSGLNYVVALIGLFGIAELLEQAYKGVLKTEAVVTTTELRAQRRNLQHDYWVRPTRLMLREKGAMTRASLVGTAVGFLPGAGSDLAAWLSSSLERVRSRKAHMTPAEVVRQEEVVVLAGTASNNAAVAGAWIPAMALGIPGDTLTAIVLGVFLIAGITPGPQLFTENRGLVNQIYLAFAVSSVVLMPIMGLLAAYGAGHITRIPFKLLMGFILGLTVVGAYAINNNPFDIFAMLIIGLFGFALKRGGFPLAQVVLGLVLGPLLEQNFMVSVIKVQWDLASFFNRPVALVLMVATVLVIAFGVRMQRAYTRDLEGQRPADPEKLEAV
ncbi:tripartite tricarboxylate transporter permease [Deinococcus sp. QL22]|uniref:tripartite tricarboxylate transporter permease n=1 Tax=Deinococcus sp. QL22 TaxID=2939437 RepID=UPI002016D912|nr:tripartite tricarboxylate transporter permease [Deinococcus sp. QL22]UQN10259.1 tripartite tricarboxylate transporter permease [Deinococcus sp. QL22]